MLCTHLQYYLIHQRLAAAAQNLFQSQCCHHFTRCLLSYIWCKQHLHVSLSWRNQSTAWLSTFHRMCMWSTQISYMLPSWPKPVTVLFLLVYFLACWLKMAVIRVSTCSPTADDAWSRRRCRKVRLFKYFVICRLALGLCVAHLGSRVLPQWVSCHNICNLLLLASWACHCPLF